MSIGGVLQYDLGRTLREGRFISTGSLNKPPTAIQNVVKELRAQARRTDYWLRVYLDQMLEANPMMKPNFEPPAPEADQLFREDYYHKDGERDCRHCTIGNLVQREPRIQHDPVVHYGLIGSANLVMKDAITRERLRKDRGILCFALEAVGLMTDLPCIVIRGICGEHPSLILHPIHIQVLTNKTDYCDSHKNKRWQSYAAATAAAYSKELLIILPSPINITALADQTVGPQIDLSILPLAGGTAFGSFSDQFHARCHPKLGLNCSTRSETESRVLRANAYFWLNGMAGTGKSTISRTIAQESADHSQLGASFSFKRGEGTRGDASRFFTTLAAHLVQHLPVLIPYVEKILQMEPNISGKTMKEQFERFILRPLAEFKNQRYAPLVIVIDVLDECENYSHVKQIIHLFAEARFIQTVNVRVFLTSRPELPIRLGFEEISGGAYQDHILHEIPHPTIEHDIETFLKDELAMVQKQNEHWLAPDWPGEQNIQTLVTMAVPLFIFAATICRFIGDRRWDPEEQLKIVLKYQNAGQTDLLDKIYQPIMNQMLADRTDVKKKKLFKKFRYIINSIVTLADPLSVNALANLLDIPKNIIDRILGKLHSVLDVSSSPDTPVRLWYLSFRDFLINPIYRNSQF